MGQVIDISRARVGPRLTPKEVKARNRKLAKLQWKNHPPSKPVGYVERTATVGGPFTKMTEKERKQLREAYFAQQKKEFEAEDDGIAESEAEATVEVPTELVSPDQAHISRFFLETLPPGSSHVILSASEYLKLLDLASYGMLRVETHRKKVDTIPPRFAAVEHGHDFVKKFRN